MMRALGTACVALLLVGCGGTVGSGVRDEGAAALGDKAAVSPAAAAGEDTSAAVPASSSPGTAFVYLLRFDQPERFWVPFLGGGGVFALSAIGNPRRRVRTHPSGRQPRLAGS